MSIAQPPPELDREFFYLFGNIAFIHAGIEQDMKDILIVEWECKESEIELLYGHKLRSIFLEKIQKGNIPISDYQKFLALMERFGIASRKRNDILKATYGYFEETNEFYKYDLRIMRQERQKDNIKVGKKSWMQFISFDELENLITELIDIREENFQLCKSIHFDKLNKVRTLKMFGIPIPDNSIKNVYKYIQNLGKENKNGTE